MIDHATISVWLVDGQSRTKLIDNLLEFKLDQQVNRHTKVCLKGVTSSRDTEIAAEAKIEIKQQDEMIFRGDIVTYQISTKSQYWELELEAASTTCELDLEVKRRTFQNEKLTYSEMIKSILAEYPGAQYDIPSDYGKKTVDQFYLQFDETDWQHLIRLASALNLVIIADSTAEKPKIHFGLPSASATTKPVPKTAAYHLVKDWSAYRLVTENSLLTQTAETDYEIYQVEETGDLLNVGDPVKYHGDDRFIYQVTVTKYGSELIQECRLAKTGGFQQTRIYNEALRGLTIKGTVVEQSVGQDQEPPVAVKVRFTIDKLYEPKHKTENPGIYHWFPYAPFYAAEGSTGLYCLPEVGEQVALYFPGCKEEDAFVTNSYRISDKVTIADPNIKCLRTAFGKEIVFTENGIKIVGKEGPNQKKDLVYIELESDGNFTVYSDSKVAFKAAQTLNAHAKGKVEITADDYIYLTSNGCSIRMTGGNDFKGLKVPQKQGKAGKQTKKRVNNVSAQVAALAAVRANPDSNGKKNSNDSNSQEKHHHAEKDKYCFQKVDGVTIQTSPQTYPVYIRCDLVESFESVVKEINELGGKILSSGAKRSLSDTGRSGTSKTSLHYFGRAVDLYIYGGMQDSSKDQYVIVKNGGTDDNPRWKVYCRTNNKNVAEIKLSAAKYVSGSGIKNQDITGRFICVTDIMKKNGWEGISARTGWKNDFMKVEWWHFQRTDSLGTGTTMKSELLKVYNESEINSHSKLKPYLEYKWNGGTFK